MNPTVLIVDGDVSNARLLQLLLSLDGIGSVIAHDAFEALALVSTRAVELVALELRLPDMHGSELARQLRAAVRGKTLPLVVFHAVDSDEELERARAADVDALIEKPYRGKQVRATIAKMLGVTAPRPAPAVSSTSGVRARVRPSGPAAGAR